MPTVTLEQKPKKVISSAYVKKEILQKFKENKADPKKSKAVVFISLEGNEFYTPDYFGVTPSAVVKNFGETFFVIGDSIHSSNIKARKELQNRSYTEEECIAEAQKMGENWIWANKQAFIKLLQQNKVEYTSDINSGAKLISYIQRLNKEGKINFNILRFNEWEQVVRKHAPNFETTNKEYLKHFSATDINQNNITNVETENSTIYKKCLIEAAKFVTSHLNNPDYVADSDLSEDDQKKILLKWSIEYLKHEGLYITYGPAIIGMNITFYEGKQSDLLKEIQRKFVDFKQLQQYYYGWAQIDFRCIRSEHIEDSDNENNTKAAPLTRIPSSDDGGPEKTFPVFIDGFSKLVTQQVQQVQQLPPPLSPIEQSAALHPWTDKDKDWKTPSVGRNPYAMNGIKMELKIQFTDRKMTGVTVSAEIMTPQN